jgi:hypothetical protein
MERNMMLTSDEYIALMRLVSSERESEGSSLADAEKPKAKQKRRPSKYNMAFKRAYNDLRKRHSKKNGDLRKGYDHTRLMTMAHAVVRRSMK